MDAVSRIGGSRGLIGVRMRTRNLIRGHAAKKCGADHLRRRYVVKVRVHGDDVRLRPPRDPTVTFSTAPDLVDYSSFSFKRPAPGPPRLPGQSTTVVYCAQVGCSRSRGLKLAARVVEGKCGDCHKLANGGRPGPHYTATLGWDRNQTQWDPLRWLSRNLNLIPGS
jgi:hypothetical protein